jgi:predicted protein tyrosine phosphatase
MIIVCSLRAAEEQVVYNKANKAISILSPGSDFPIFQTLQSDSHLCLSFNDVAGLSPGLAAPQSHDMQKLLLFIKAWDKTQPLLIHCWAGVSRSTAAAYIATCLLQPAHDEVELALALRAASPSATPNPLLIALADDALGREGRMKRAIQSIGRGANAYEGGPFTLHIQK